MTAYECLRNPCRVSSIPFWKTRNIAVPDHMKIVHDKDFDTAILKEYDDEQFFRLRHTLYNLILPKLPEHFIFCAATIDEFSEHINSCYVNLFVKVEELKEYRNHPVYSPDLWLAVKDDRTGMIVASGIAELDNEIGEGVLEWIQVSNAFRGLGLGSCIVNELLLRMNGKAEFVTVSGQCNNSSNPEALYRSCGFTGNDIWHILRKR